MSSTREDLGLLDPRTFAPAWTPPLPPAPGPSRVPATSVPQRQWSIEDAQAFLARRQDLQQNLAAQEEAAKPPEPDAPWWADVLGWTVQKPLEYAQWGGRAVTAGIENLARQMGEDEEKLLDQIILPTNWVTALAGKAGWGDGLGIGIFSAIDEERVTDEEIRPWHERANDPTYSWADAAVDQFDNPWLDKPFNFAMDVATDPLTYVTLGSAKLAGAAARESVAAAMSRAAAAGTRDFSQSLITKVARRGTAYLDDADRAFLGLEKSGLRFMGARIPATGLVARGTGRFTGSVRQGITGSKPWHFVFRGQNGFAISDDGMREIRKALRGRGSDIMDVPTASALLALDNTIRREAETIVGTADQIVRPLFAGKNAEELTAMSRRLEQGNFDDLKEVNEWLYKMAEDANVDLGHLGDNFITHLWTDEAKAFMAGRNIQQGKRTIKVGAGRSTKSRSILPDQELIIDGVPVNIGDGSIADINRGLSQAFPGQKFDKWLIDDARELTRVYVTTMAGDIALAKGFMKIAAEHPNVIDWVEHVSDDVVKGLADRTKSKELRDSLKGVVKQRADDLAKDKEEAKVVAAELQAALAAHFQAEAAAQEGVVKRLAEIVEKAKGTSADLQSQRQMVADYVKEVRDEVEGKLAAIREAYAELDEKVVAARLHADQAKAGEQQRILDWTSQSWALKTEAMRHERDVQMLDQWTGELAAVLDRIEEIGELMDNPQALGVLSQAFLQDADLMETVALGSVREATSRYSAAADRTKAVFDAALEKDPDVTQMGALADAQSRATQVRALLEATNKELEAAIQLRNERLSVLRQHKVFGTKEDPIARTPSGERVTRGLFGEGQWDNQDEVEGFSDMIVGHQGQGTVSDDAWRATYTPPLDEADVDPDAVWGEFQPIADALADPSIQEDETIWPLLDTLIELRRARDELKGAARVADEQGTGPEAARAARDASKYSIPRRQRARNEDRRRLRDMAKGVRQTHAEMEAEADRLLGSTNAQDLAEGRVPSSDFDRDELWKPYDYTDRLPEHRRPGTTVEAVDESRRPSVDTPSAASLVINKPSKEGVSTLRREARLRGGSGAFDRFDEMLERLAPQERAYVRAYRKWLDLEDEMEQARHVGADEWRGWRQDEWGQQYYDELAAIEKRMTAVIRELSDARTALGRKDNIYNGSMWKNYRKSEAHVVSLQRRANSLESLARKAEDQVGRLTDNPNLSAARRTREIAVARQNQAAMERLVRGATNYVPLRRQNAQGEWQRAVYTLKGDVKWVPEERTPRLHYDTKKRQWFKEVIDGDGNSTWQPTNARGTTRRRKDGTWEKLQVNQWGEEKWVPRDVVAGEQVVPVEDLDVIQYYHEVRTKLHQLDAQRAGYQLGDKVMAQGADVQSAVQSAVEEVLTARALGGRVHLSELLEANLLDEGVLSRGHKELLDRYRELRDEMGAFAGARDALTEDRILTPERAQQIASRMSPLEGQLFVAEQSLAHYRRLFANWANRLRDEEKQLRAATRAARDELNEYLRTTYPGARRLSDKSTEETVQYLPAMRSDKKLAELRKALKDAQDIERAAKIERDKLVTVVDNKGYSPEDGWGLSDHADLRANGEFSWLIKDEEARRWNEEIAKLDDKIPELSKRVFEERARVRAAEGVEGAVAPSAMGTAEFESKVQELADLHEIIYRYDQAVKAGAKPGEGLAAAVVGAVKGQMGRLDEYELQKLHHGFKGKGRNWQSWGRYVPFDEKTGKPIEGAAEVDLAREFFEKFLWEAMDRVRPAVSEKKHAQYLMRAYYGGANTKAATDPRWAAEAAEDARIVRRFNQQKAADEKLSADLVLARRHQARIKKAAEEAGDDPSEWAIDRKGYPYKKTHDPEIVLSDADREIAEIKRKIDAGEMEASDLDEETLERLFLDDDPSTWSYDKREAWKQQLAVMEADLERHAQGMMGNAETLDVIFKKWEGDAFFNPANKESTFKRHIEEFGEAVGVDPTNAEAMRVQLQVVIKELKEDLELHEEIWDVSVRQAVGPWWDELSPAEKRRWRSKFSSTMAEARTKGGQKEQIGRLTPPHYSKSRSWQAKTQEVRDETWERMDDATKDAWRREAFNHYIQLKAVEAASETTKKQTGKLWDWRDVLDGKHGEALAAKTERLRKQMAQVEKARTALADEKAQLIARAEYLQRKIEEATKWKPYFVDEDGFGKVEFIDPVKASTGQTRLAQQALRELEDQQMQLLETAGEAYTLLEFYDEAMAADFRRIDAAQSIVKGLQQRQGENAVEAAEKRLAHLREQARRLDRSQDNAINPEKDDVHKTLDQLSKIVDDIKDTDYQSKIDGLMAEHDELFRQGDGDGAAAKAQEAYEWVQAQQAMEQAVVVHQAFVEQLMKVDEAGRIIDDVKGAEKLLGAARKADGKGRGKSSASAQAAYDAMQNLEVRIVDGHLDDYFEHQLKVGWTMFDPTFKTVEGGRGYALSPAATMAFMDTYDDRLPNKFSQYFDAATRLFKTWAVATPGFHVRNAMSAAVMNLVAGVRPKWTRMGAQVWKEYLDNPRLFLTTNPEGTLKGDAIRAVFGSGAGGGFSVEELGTNHSWWFDNGWLRMNRRAGQNVEGSIRLGMALDSLDKGLDVGMAQARIETFHFNYSKLSSLDRAAKKVFPFWTFMSRNIPLQMQMMYTRPGMYAAYDKAYNEFEPSIPLPEWLTNRKPLGIGGNNVLAVDMPWLGIQDEVGMAFDPRDALASSNPVITQPFEMITGKGIRFDNDLGDPAERMGRGIRGLLPLVGQADRLSGGRLGPLSAGSNAGDENRQGAAAARWTGIPLHNISEEQQRWAMLRAAGVLD